MPGTEDQRADGVEDDGVDAERDDPDAMTAAELPRERAAGVHTPTCFTKMASSESPPCAALISASGALIRILPPLIIVT